jgi:acyl-CoA hydrolase
MEEIYDGCCLQLGIGSLPNTIGQMIANSDLKDMGIQTEMFCNAMVEMYEKGKITNKYKATDKYKTTYAFGLGDKKLYEYMDYIQD